MLKVDKVYVMNFENAIRGARNPLNSWDRMESYYDEKGNFVLGENDLALATKLAKAGSDHRKYLRQIPHYRYQAPDPGAGVCTRGRYDP